MIDFKISPSLMCVDFCDLNKSINELNQAKPDYFHIDVMDGVFVPNITLSPDIAKVFRKLSDIPFDYHFMICSPLEKMDWFVIKENDLVSIHIEACKQNEEETVYKFINKVHSLNALAGLAVSPDTDIESIYKYLNLLDFVVVMTVYPGFAGQKLVEKCLPKIEQLSAYLSTNNLNNVMIEVDGNVSFENAVKMRKLGANIFVGGSSSVFYKGDTINNNMIKLNDMLKGV